MMSFKKQIWNTRLGLLLFTTLGIVGILGYLQHLKSVEISLKEKLALKQHAYEASKINFELFHHYKPLLSKLHERLQTNPSQASSESLLDSLKKAQSITRINQVDFRITATTPEPLISKIKTIQHEVQVKFKAFREEEAFAFLEALSGTLPGHIVAEKVYLNKLKPLSYEMLKDVKEGRKPDLLSGEYYFQWIVPIKQKDDL